MDSELVVKQMLGQYSVKNKGLAPLYAKARQLSLKFSHFDISHVRREANKEADHLVDLAMDRGFNEVVAPEPGKATDKPSIRGIEGSGTISGICRSTP